MMKVLGKTFFYIFLYFFIVNFAFAENKKILIIGSYHKDYQWQMDYTQGLKNTLGKKYDYFEFALNTKRINETEFEKVAGEAFEYYKKIKPDLVVLGDDNALKLLKDRFMKEKIPIVFLGINANIRNYFEQRPNNFAGILERPFYKRNMLFIKESIPSIKKILILLDYSETARTIVQEEFEGRLKTEFLGAEVIINSTNSFEEWKTIVNIDSSKYDAVILGVYHTVRDKNGKIVDENELLHWTSENIKKPLFGTWSFSVGKGKTIGGLVLSGTAQGEEAGKVIQRILEKGEKPISIFPVTAEKGQYLINLYELNRWKVKIPSKYKDMIKVVD